MSSKKKDDDRKWDRSIYAYDLVNSWINNADNKVCVSCGILTGAFGVITFLSEKVRVTQTVNDYFKGIYFGTLIISVILFIISLLFYILAINPNLGKSEKKRDTRFQKKEYPLYYGDINEISFYEYKDLMKKGSDQSFIDEIQAETHYNSGICISKMKKYKIGLWFSFSAVVIALISLLAHYMMYR